MLLSTRRRTAGVLSSSLLGVLGILAVPAASQADIVATSPCDNAPLSQPFLPWGDSALYKLAPGGDFESADGGGWSLQNGATIVSGSETYAVSGTLGRSSLSLPAGAIATSPPTCVNAAYPVFRLFSRSDDFALLRVSVVYGSNTISVGVLNPSNSWQLSQRFLTLSIAAGALSGGNAQMQLQFTSLRGDSQIDDIYVDPWGRCC